MAIKYSGFSKKIWMVFDFKVIKAVTNTNHTKSLNLVIAREKLTALWKVDFKKNSSFLTTSHSFLQNISTDEKSIFQQSLWETIKKSYITLLDIHLHYIMVKIFYSFAFYNFLYRKFEFEFKTLVTYSCVMIHKWLKN